MGSRGLSPLCKGIFLEDSSSPFCIAEVLISHSAVLIQGSLTLRGNSRGSGSFWGEQAVGANWMGGRGHHIGLVKHGLLGGCQAHRAGDTKALLAFVPSFGQHEFPLVGVPV